MTTTDREQQPDEETHLSEREASRLSYRSGVPEDWRDEFDRLTRRMQPQRAAAVVRDRIRRRKAEAALPAAEAVMAGIGRR